jgi:2,5-diamino-6-(ribosylamino)-4(3H)-pyrimidinone 5'-phosphate reductase
MIPDRPHVILNAAMTADGKLDTVARRGAAISSLRDRERVDRLRAESDAVMVGGRTLLGDDPRLTVKAAALRAARMARGLEENPLKVGLTSNLALLRDDSRFLTTGPARVILFTTRQTDPAQIRHLSERGAQVFVMGERKVDLADALRRLKEMGVGRLLVEGGGTLNAELLCLGLVDEIYLYLAPLIFSGATAPTLADGEGLTREEAIQLQLRGVETLDEGGVVLHYGVTYH